MQLSLHHMDPISRSAVFRWMDREVRVSVLCHLDVAMPERARHIHDVIKNATVDNIQRLRFNGFNDSRFDLVRLIDRVERFDPLL